MGKKTGIEWADATHNFWYGCTKVSDACNNCYAERDMKRFGKDFDKLTRVKAFDAPLKWKEPSRIFVCSWSDFFHEDVPEDWRRDAWEIMYHAGYKHTFLLLTKRPENIKDMLPVGYIEGMHKYWKHVWLGVTAENQKQADIRIPLLLEIPAAVRFVSCEPLLGKINLWGNETGLVGNKEWNGQLTFIEGLDWVITGGESGTNCRDMKYEWAEFLKKQCGSGETPFFMKQMSGRTKAEREAIPEDLLIREFPDSP